MGDAHASSPRQGRGCGEALDGDDGSLGSEVFEMKRGMIVLSLLVLAMPLCADGARGADEGKALTLPRQDALDDGTVASGLRETFARATPDQDETTTKMMSVSGQGPDDATVVSGLKEALAVATAKAVTEVGRVDGYFSNQAIKILLPERFQKVAQTLNMLGFQKEVDAFVLSMNRAAEHAAPKAEPYFSKAVKEMTFEDATGILKGGDTAATEYFKAKTYSQLYEAFKPDVAASMNEAGVTRSYKAMMEKYQALPFMKVDPLDLDRYVTEKSLDGLFTMVGQEETEIRTNPAAQATSVLRKVFGKSGQ